MDPLSAYIIPIQGLKTGLHEYHYTLDYEFFSHFEGSLIREGVVEAQVSVDKRPSLIIIAFRVSGYTQTTCDRCMAPIQLPLNEETRQIIIKFGEAEEMEDDDEVVFLSREASEFQLASYLYEFTLLALPLTNVYDCESENPPPCNQEVLNILKASSQRPANPIWEALNKLQ